MPALVFIVFIIALLALFKYAFAYPKLTAHQTLTLTVETPNGPVSGQSTQSVKWTFDENQWHGLRAQTRIRGEAVFVDLGEGRYLIMNLEDGGSSMLPMANIVNKRYRGDESREESFRRFATNFDVLEMPPNVIRPLITFDDPSDETSVRLVKPEEIAEVFGEGYRFGSVTIQATDGRVTKGRLVKVLPWLLEPQESARSDVHVYASKFRLFQK